MSLRVGSDIKTPEFVEVANSMGTLGYTIDY